MAWVLKLSKQSEEDLQWLKKNNSRLLKKCFELMKEIEINPKTGKGKPERLKYTSSETWSRRISQKDRIVYEILEEKETVYIVSCREHY